VCQLFKEIRAADASLEFRLATHPGRW